MKNTNSLVGRLVSCGCDEREGRDVKLNSIQQGENKMQASFVLGEHLNC